MIFLDNFFAVNDILKYSSQADNLSSMSTDNHPQGLFIILSG
jgi:hypothetical protein